MRDRGEGSLTGVLARARNAPDGPAAAGKRRHPRLAWPDCDRMCRCTILPRWQKDLRMADEPRYSDELRIPISITLPWSGRLTKTGKPWPKDRSGRDWPKGRTGNPVFPIHELPKGFAPGTSDIYRQASPETARSVMEHFAAIDAAMWAELRMVQKRLNSPTISKAVDWEPRSNDREVDQNGRAKVDSSVEKASGHSVAEAKDDEFGRARTAARSHTSILRIGGNGEDEEPPPSLLKGLRELRLGKLENEGFTEVYRLNASEILQSGTAAARGAQASETADAYSFAERAYQAATKR